MNSLPNNITALLVCLLIFSSKITAQIAKGDYNLRFSSGIYYSDLSTKRPHANSRVSYMKAINNKLMLGGSVFHNYHFQLISETTGGWNYHTFNTYEFSPTIRYYFINRKFAPFAELNNSFQFTKFNGDTPFDNRSGFGTVGAIGFNYFLGNSIAIETAVKSNLIRLGDFAQHDRYISLSTGLRLFFNSSFSNKIDSLPSKILHRGNFTSSASLSMNFQETSSKFFSFSPNIRYFLTDRFNIYGSYRFDYSLFNGQERHNMSLGLGVQHYFKLTNSLYFSLGATGTLNYSSITSINNEDRRLIIPIAGVLNYYVKNSRLYAGIVYRTYKSQNNTYNIDNRLGFLGGIDYFVLDNVYLKANFGFYRTEYLRSPFDRSSGAFQLGMGFFFNQYQK